jgi:TRAP transporter TAXI family solute receptor
MRFPSLLRTHRRLLGWGSVLILTLILVGISRLWLEPPPPSRIVMATGQPGGTYDTLGREYANQLRRQGLRVEIVQTNGSVDNLERLIQGKVDLAFAQGGTSSLVSDPRGLLRGLAAIYFEPLWVFYRGRLRGELLSAMAGRRIAIGPVLSGTEAVSRAILRENGIDSRSAHLVNLTNNEARAQLETGRLDGLFLVGSYQDPAVQALLRRKDIRLLDFGRDMAYARRFPYLTPVKLFEGLIDLQTNIPPREHTLLAAPAMLVCRESLHPQVIEQVLRIAQRLHAPGSLMDPPHRFPTVDGMDLPVQETAETFFATGESFLARTLPYWAVRWLFLLRLFVLPAIILWLPLVRLLPLIYAWRAGRLLRRFYGNLQEIEAQLQHAQRANEVRDGLAALEALRGEVDRLSPQIPAGRQHEGYEWRVHASLVRDEALERLARLESRAGA